MQNKSRYFIFGILVGSIFLIPILIYVIIESLKEGCFSDIFKIFRILSILTITAIIMFFLYSNRKIPRFLVAINYILFFYILLSFFVFEPYTKESTNNPNSKGKTPEEIYKDERGSDLSTSMIEKFELPEDAKDIVGRW